MPMAVSEFVYPKKNNPSPFKISEKASDVIHSGCVLDGELSSIVGRECAQQYMEEP